MRHVLKLRPLLLALMATACSQGAEIASPGTTAPGTGSGGGGSTGGGGGGGGTATCPTGTTNGGALGSLTICNLTGEILSNFTLPNVASVVYRINGRVDVGRDVGGDGSLTTGVSGSLTISPGVRLFGTAGTDVLIVNRGSQIFANGTVSQPIVFTSQAAIQGFNNAQSSRQWAGVILAGRAPTRKCQTGVQAGSVSCQNTVEGILASTGRPALYGGATPADNSGSLQYVQVNYAGAFLPGAGSGDDLNGLTLAGVGSGTTVSFVQVNNSGDDGIEIFGGRVNLRNIIVTGAFDDAFDCDEGYNGNTQFALIISRLYSAGGATGPDSLVECSNAAGASSPSTGEQTQPTITNFTFIGQPLNDAGGALRGVRLDANGGAPGAGARLANGVVVNATNCLALTDSGGANLPLVLVDSVLFDCGASGTTSSQALGRLTAGTNNSGPTPTQNNGSYVARSLIAPSAPVTASTPAFVTTFVNGANETARPIFDATTNYGAFFTPVTYIGAVRNTSDNWWRTWSCGLENVNCQ